jgi:hypothetical protein
MWTWDKIELVPEDELKERRWISSLEIKLSCKAVFLRQDDTNGDKLVSQLDVGDANWPGVENKTEMSSVKLELATEWNGVQSSCGVFK